MAAIGVKDVAFLSAFEEKVFRFPLHATGPNGAASVQEIVHLPRNAVVLAPWRVTVRAGKAPWTFANAVAQLRVKDISKPGAKGQQRTSVVIDFGGLRTVSAIGLMNSSFSIIRALSWTGAKFGDAPVVGTRFGVLDATSDPATELTGYVARFPSEVRTERLQVDLVGVGTDATVGAALVIELPDAPADLELRINDGAPVWTSAGAVVKGAPGWTDDDALQKQEVDLSDALTALLGDPTADITPDVELKLTLSARIPGALQLVLPTAQAQTIRYITAVSLSNADAALEFAAEGLERVALALPAWVRDVEELRMKVTADLPPERTLPSVGPAPSLIGATTQPLAELLLDADHAAVFDITGIERVGSLGEIVGARVPMVVGRRGVELQMLLLARAVDVGGLPFPSAPLRGGSSKPLVLDASPNDVESWATFVLPKAVKIDASAVPFVAIIATRGDARCAFTGDARGCSIWRGPPAGPFTELPSLGGLPAMRGRVRVTGHAARQTPIAPLQVSLGSAASPMQDVSPTAKGIALSVRLAAPVTPGASGTAPLSIVSRVPGTVSLADVRLIVARKPQ